MSDIIPDILLIGELVQLNDRHRPYLGQFGHTFEGAQEVRSELASNAWTSSGVGVGGGVFFWKEVIPYG